MKVSENYNLTKKPQLISRNRKVYKLRENELWKYILEELKDVEWEMLHGRPFQ